VLAFPELLYSAQLVYSANFQTIPLLIAASLWYLLVTSILSIGQYFIERHYNRGSGKPVQKGNLARLISTLRTRTLKQEARL